MASQASSSKRSEFLRKVKKIAGTTDVEGTVFKALTDQSVDAIEKLRTIRQCVLPTDVISAIINTCDVHAHICRPLTKDILDYFTEYYILLGPETATKLVERCYKLLHGNGVRNIALILSHMIGSMNVVHPKRLSTYLSKTFGKAIAPIAQKDLGGFYILLRAWFCLINTGYVFVDLEDFEEKFDEALGYASSEDPFIGIIYRLQDSTYDKYFCLPPIEVDITDWERDPTALLARIIAENLAILSANDDFRSFVQFCLFVCLNNDQGQYLEQCVTEASRLCCADSQKLWRPFVSVLVEFAMAEHESLYCGEDPQKKKKKSENSIDDTAIAPILNLLNLVPLETLRKKKINALIALCIRSFGSRKSLTRTSAFRLLDRAARELNNNEIDVDFSLLTDSNLSFSQISKIHLNRVMYKCFAVQGTSLDSVPTPFKAWHFLKAHRITAAAYNESLQDKLISLIDGIESDDVVSWGCLLDALQTWDESILASEPDKLLTKKRRRKFVERATYMINAEQMAEDLRTVAVSFYIHKGVLILKPIGKADRAYAERLFDWRSLSRLSEKNIQLIFMKVKPNKMVDFIREFPLPCEETNYLKPLRVALHTNFQKCIELLNDFLPKLLTDPTITPEIFSATIGAISTPKYINKPLVSLVLTMVMFLFEDPTHTKSGKSLHDFGETLRIALRNAPSAVLHDKCALYTELFGCFVKYVAELSIADPSNEYLPSLRNTCETIVTLIANFSEFFEKTLPGLIATHVLLWEQLPLTFVKLCSVTKPRLSACLATNLPAAEKRAFAHLMVSVKLANVKIV